MTTRARRLVIALTTAAVLLPLSATVGPVGPASATPTGGAEAVVTLVADGIREPHALRAAPDGRLFLLQQAGRVRVVQKGRLLRAPALVIDPAVIVEHNNSAGLLSIAFPPDFTTASVQHVYLLYTHEPMTGYPYRHNVVSRWTITGNAIDPTSEQVLVHLDPLVDGAGAFATSHYGGDMEFGADGKLYVSTGDLYNSVNGQDLSTLHGKILRFNPDGTIPASNPYVGVLTGPLQSIWSVGLRNPFKLTLDRRDGRIVIGDVGSTKFEEVNVLEPRTPAGNFGWADVEGYTSDPAYTSPVLAYPHVGTADELTGCAVMGGDIYRPRTTLFPAVHGDYLFADFCQGWVRALDLSTGVVGQPLATGFHAPVDIAVTKGGVIWVAERQLADGVPGGLFRIDPATGDGTPVITGEPSDASVASGGQVSFVVYASGTAPLSYQWYRDGVAMSGETSGTLTVPPVSSADDGAQFQVRVSNAVGVTWSRVATLSVTTNTAPTPAITTPSAGSTYAAGETLHLSGSATDPEDGTLPPSAYTWEVDFHHNTHVHEITGPVTGSATLDVPLSRTLETDTDVFYRVRLTVRDSQGASATITRDVQPRLTSFSLTTIPSGVPLLVDGSSAPTPSTIASVVGVTRTVAATSASVAGVGWTFDSWAGGSTSASRTFDAPSGATSFVGYFRPSGGSIGTGTGLRATYYASTSLASPVLSRVDRVPYFSWPSSPVSGVPKDDFAVQWRGDVHAQFTGPMHVWAPLRRDETLSVVIGGVTVIDASTTNGEVTGSVPVSAGQRYPIVITFTDGSGSAEVHLTYGPDQARRSVLAGSQLYPAP